MSKKKTSGFVAKDICIINHNIYVMIYCTITAKYKQPVVWSWSSICAASRPHMYGSGPFLALWYLPSFPFLSDIKIEHMRSQCRRRWRADTTHRVSIFVLKRWCKSAARYVNCAVWHRLTVNKLTDATCYQYFDCWRSIWSPAMPYKERIKR